MPQSLSALFIHLVFSTKNRSPFLSDKQLREETHRYLGGICNGLGCQPIIVGGPENHVHVLACMGRTITPADFVKTLKGSSTNWLKDEGFRGFSWQNVYRAFSVSKSDVAVVREYIRTQDEHHITRTFEEEFLAMLVEHELTYHERYVFD